MDIIGLSIGEETSQFAFVKITENSMQVKEVATIEEPLLAYIQQKNVTELTAFLKRFKLKSKNTKLYVSYPSSLGYIDCFCEENITLKEFEEAQNDWIFEHMHYPEKDNYYADAPLKVKCDSNLYVTTMYLHMEIANIIMEAAINAGFKTVEGEPEAFATARLITNEQKINYILEVEAENTTIISYNTEKGLFSLPIPDQGWNQIMDETSSYNAIKKLWELFTIANLNSIRTFNEDIDNFGIYIVSQKSQEITQILEKYTERIQPLKLPNLIESEIDESILLQYMTPLGLCLKELIERMKTNEDEGDSEGEYISQPNIEERSLLKKICNRIPGIERFNGLFHTRDND